MSKPKEDAAGAVPETTTPPNIYQRINRVMADVDGVIKDKRNREQGFDYSSHDAVVESVRAAMVTHGIVFNLGMESIEHERVDVPAKSGGTRSVYETCAWFRWRLTNADDPSDRIDDPEITRVWMHALSSDDKGPGKLVSYAKKYALLACVGFLLPTGIDLDEESIPAPQGQPAPKRDLPANAVKATPATGNLDELKAKYVAMAKKYGIELKAFGEAFSRIVPEDKRQDAKAVNSGLLEMEKRCCAWLDVLEAIKKWSVSGDMFDASVAKIVGGDEVVSKDNYFLFKSETLAALANQVHEDNDLPFDGEGKAIPK